MASREQRYKRWNLMREVWLLRQHQNEDAQCSSRKTYSAHTAQVLPSPQLRKKFEAWSLPPRIPSPPPTEILRSSGSSKFNFHPTTETQYDEDFLLTHVGKRPRTELLKRLAFGKALRQQARTSSKTYAGLKPTSTNPNAWRETNEVMGDRSCDCSRIGHSKKGAALLTQTIMSKKKSDDDSANMSKETGPFPNSVLMNLGAELGKDWKELGHHLGLSESMIEEIALDEQEYGVKRMAVKCLETWKRMEGDDAGLDKLRDKLLSVKRKDLADKISPNSSESVDAQTGIELTAPWTTSTGLSLAELQRELLDYRQQGYRLTNLIYYEEKGSERYLTLWVEDTTTEWAVKYAMSKVQFRLAVTSFKSKGYQITKVWGYVINNRTKFAAIWEKRKGPVVIVKINMTDEMFVDDVYSYIELDCRLLYYYSYVVNNEIYFAGIWQKSTASRPFVDRASTLMHLNELCEKYFDKGYRIHTVFGLYRKDEDFYGTLFEDESLSGVTNVICGLSLDEYFIQLEDIRVQQSIPTCVHAFASGSAVKYCIAWGEE